MPPALGRLRHRYRRSRSLDGRLDQGRRLGGDDGKRSSRRGMRYRASCNRACGAMWAFSAMRPATIRPPITTKYLRISITSPLGPQGPPHSISRGSGRVGSFSLRPCAWVRCRRLRGGWRRGNGFEPPSRAVHARALPIELPCRRSDNYPLRPCRSVQNCTPASAPTPGRRLRDATPEAAEIGS